MMFPQTFVVRPAVEGIQKSIIPSKATPRTETGRSAGAVVVLITTKSGGNNFHGSVFEFFRNSALDARNYFANPDSGQASLPPEPVRRKSRRACRKEKHRLLRELRRLPEMSPDPGFVTFPTWPCGRETSRV